MSNNTKRLSFFAKIAQRSTALQSLLEVATGKSAVGAIAPDRQGQIGKRKEHIYYTTQRYEKDIEVAQAQPTPPVVVEPAGIRAIGSSGESSVNIYASRYSDGDDENPGIAGVSKLYAWSDGPSIQLFGTASANPAQGSVVYYKFYNTESGVWEDWSTTMGAYTVTTGSPILGPCIGVDCTDSDIGYAICIDRESEAGAYGWDIYVTGTGKMGTRVYTLNEEPEPGDFLLIEAIQVGTVIAYSNITSDAVSSSNDPSAESINPNLEARIKHVKEFYRGESPWFMDSVGIKRYPNHYHVAWTVPSAADGTLSATANGYPLFNGEAVIEGATIVLTATPASGKQVNQWSGLPQGATTAGNTATFTLAAEVNASVTFAEAATVTSFMEYYYDGGGTQSIFVRDSDADIPEPTGEGAPTSYMYAWYAESQDDYRYTDTASPVADMHCVRYDGTNLWWYSSAREEWQNYSDVLYPEVPNTRSIIASIDPHMYQNIKVHLQVGEASSEVVLNRYFAGDTYDSTEGDGNVAIAWQGTLGGSPLIFYTKSVDIVASSESGQVGTHIWSHGAESWTDLTDNGNAEILAVDVVTALRFESEEENATITLSNVGTVAPTGVQYKTDGGEWTDYTMGTEITMPCEFKAESWDLTLATCEATFSASEGASVVVSGHITSLDGRYGTTNNTLTEETSFAYLFYNLHVTDASNLILASNTTDGCYNGMFYGCTSLTEAPALPATTLAVNCYSNMFRGCTALTQAPALPATILAQNCYAEMFYGCTALISAPELKATTLATSCYNAMFRDCTALVTAPALSATTLVGDCYYDMFDACTSLVTAPDLPATTLTADVGEASTSGCYEYMFYGCTNLKEHVNIAATSPYYEGTSTACDEMFAGSGTEEGAGGTINVGGNVSLWNSTNAGIDDQHWTVQVPPSEE